MGWIMRYPQGMRTHGDITATIEVQLVRRRGILLAYRDECARIADHHGVQDASSDLRELDAAEAALRWVLGERETLGY